MKAASKNKIKRKGRKLKMVFLITIAVISLLIVVGYIINSILSNGELEAIKPYGQLVDVDGSKMHVYSMGDGQETIVLLPGFGTALPSADFGPLMRELSNDYTVVCVDYFGIGFSDQTSTARTNENYTQEMRMALSAAGFQAPYIMMPHSASGVTCEYYASMYPEEISAIIMLDTTSTERIEEKNAPSFIYSIAKFQQSIGTTRLNYELTPETKLVENGYTQEEIADYKKFSYHVINDTIINQSSLLMENIKEVNKLPFPTSVPVLKIISSQSIDQMAKKDKVDGMEYQKEHLKRLGEHADYKVIDGTHFIYQTNIVEIVEATKTFLHINKINVQN